MLRKLLKYDLKKSTTFFVLVYVAMLFSAIIARLFAELGSTNFTFIMSSVFQGICWAGVATLFINNLMRLWANFRRSVYGDEGYLLHTLPVKTTTIYWSKWLTALIILLGNFLVSAGVILLAYGDNISSVFDATLEITLIISIIALEIFTIFCEGILGIILEHRKGIKSRKWGIIYGLIAFLISQLFVFISIPVAAIFDERVMNIFSEPQGIMDFEVIRLLIIISMAAYIIVIASVSILSARKITKGVNLE